MVFVTLHICLFSLPIKLTRDSMHELLHLRCTLMVKIGDIILNAAYKKGTRQIYEYESSKKASSLSVFKKKTTHVENLFVDVSNSMLLSHRDCIL